MPRAEASSSASKVSQSDPRRPGEARRYERPQVDPDSQPQDPMLFFALIFGMIALIVKVKAAAWLALFCVASALANMKTDTMDFKQIISSLTFALMGLVATYIVPVTKNK